jgi:hypothetical protein
MATKIIKGLKAIDAATVKFTTNAAKLNDQAHSLALSILKHAAPVDAGGFGHGDCTRALMLVKAMPASMRRTMLIQWFAKYSPIAVKLSDQGDNVGYTASYGKLTTDAAKLSKWDIAGADAEPFWKLAEGTPEEKVYDLKTLLKMLEGLAKRIDAIADKDGIEPTVAAHAKRIAGEVRTIN